MKKMLMLVILVLTMVCQAEEKGFDYDYSGWLETSWTPVQLSLVPEVSLFYSGVPVYGLSLSYAGNSQNQVIGLNLSVLATMTRQAIGITGSPVFNVYDDNYGLAVSSINVCGGDIVGLAVGLLNYVPSENGGAGCMVGVLNYDGHGVQFGLVNISSDSWQFGLINYNFESIIPYTILFNCPWPWFDSKTNAVAP